MIKGRMLETILRFSLDTHTVENDKAKQMGVFVVMVVIFSIGLKWIGVSFYCLSMLCRDPLK